MSCENEPDHNNYCKSCATCHVCLEEYQLSQEQRIEELESNNRYLQDILNAYEMFEGRVGDSLHKTNDSRLEAAFEQLEEDLVEIKGD